MFFCKIKFPHSINSILIKTDSIEVIDILSDYYGEYFAYLEDSSVKYIEIICEHDGYIIINNNQTFKTSYLLKTIGRIIYDNIIFSEKIFTLHGAALEKGNKAILFLAPTLTGKTTLTSYLTSRGCGYITDDCILIDKNTLKIHPFTLPLHLREGGYRLLCDETTFDMDVKKVSDGLSTRYVYMPAKKITDQIIVEKIFFLKRNLKHNRFVEMSKVERINTLINSIYKYEHIYELDIKMLDSLARNKCYVLWYKDLSYIYENI